MKYWASRRGFLQAAALAGFTPAGESRGLPSPLAPAPAKGRGRTRALDQEALENILVGCSYLGCGGGGSLAEGQAVIAEGLQSGLRYELLAVADLSDEEWVASPYGLGSNAPPTDAEKKRFEDLSPTREDPEVASFRRLSAFLKRDFVATIAGELGPWSTAAALSTAAHLNIPALDADRVGRATPEANQDSVLLAGLSTLPLAAVTKFGDSLILEKVARESRVEDLLRSIAVASLGDVGVTDAALPGRDAKRPGALVVGSISHAEAVGKASRRATAAHKDPIEAVLAAGSGYRLFEGEVVDFPWKDDAGFLVGEVIIDGRGAFRSSRYRVHYKNENLMAWRNDQVSVTPPDLISIVDSGTGGAIANPDFRRGQHVTVLGFPAPAIWRTAAGLQIFGPAHFGFDAPYVPIEQRHD